VELNGKSLIRGEYMLDNLFSTNTRGMALLLAALVAAIAGCKKDEPREAKPPVALTQLQQAQQAYKNGLRYFDTNDFSSAEHEFAMAVSYDPELIEAHYLKGICLLKHEISREFWLERAVDCFDTVLQLDPDFRDAKAQRLAASQELGALVDKRRKTGDSYRFSVDAERLGAVDWPHAKNSQSHRRWVCPSCYAARE
jgi:tetratricopeptide (TPR) repeat protein